MEKLVAQSCPTLCDPVDCSLLGSSVHGILQARILEWVAFPSSGDLHHQPRSLALQAGALVSEPPGKPEDYMGGNDLEKKQNSPFCHHHRGQQ